jgi:N-acetylglucosamine-6-phosphate deacetylase
MKGIYDFLGPEGFGAYDIDWEGGTATRVSRPPKGLLIPGFVDIHIHGGFGIDFMGSQPGDMAALCGKLEREGYEAFLPTTVTASAKDVLRAVNSLPDHPLIAGFHLEGPFISPTYPGAQPPSAITPVPEGDSEWDEVFDHPLLKVVTLAPELPNALELIARLMKRGVSVGMGHTNSTYEEARRGFEFGASHTTHTFNAMRPFHHREAGTVGYALANDDLATELIYDRLHVSRDAAGILVKCKPVHQLIAVSDGTEAIGLPPGQTITMWGLKCIVGRRQVRLEDGTLAGSGITLLDAFRNLHEDFGPELAIRACCVNPRRIIGMTSPPRVYLELDKQLKVVDRHSLA